MKIKVCGMRNPGNIEELSFLPIDYMGFIFYPESSRYAGELQPGTLHVIPDDIKKTGVFVNEEVAPLFNRIEKYDLDVVQLHGNETPEYCEDLIETFPETMVIKAFSISQTEDLVRVKEYEEVCDLFLFDTKTPQYGGSGQKFDWNILDDYQGEIPFFLSGGISIDDIEDIKKIQHPKLYGLDLNSRFETEPGLKNTILLQAFIEKVRQ